MGDASKIEWTPMDGVPHPMTTSPPAPDLAAIERRITEYDAELNDVENSVSRRGYGQCFDDCRTLLAALRAMEAERDDALADAGNDRTLAASRLEGRREAEEAASRLRGCLERSACPLPVAGDGGTVAGCIAADHCGCENRTALADPRVRRIVEKSHE